MRRLIVSLHDVHPGSLAAIREQRRALTAWGVDRVSLLVVPRWHGAPPCVESAEFRRSVDAWRDGGDEVVLHGWRHDVVGQSAEWKNVLWRRLYTAGESEFQALDEAEARRRLEAGRSLFSKVGWETPGFIAPAWLMSPATLTALRALGFHYTNTRTELLPLTEGSAPIAATSLCYSVRSAWRRAASPLWNGWLFARVRRNSLLRLSLHPADFTAPAVRLQIGRIVTTALADGVRPTTYAQTMASRTPEAAL